MKCFISGLIHLVYPNAVILHTVRDPMDTLFSCYKNKFDDKGLEWALDIKDLVLQYSVKNNINELLYTLR